jgi:hypothetical protein
MANAPLRMSHFIPRRPRGAGWAARMKLLVCLFLLMRSRACAPRGVRASLRALRTRGVSAHPRARRLPRSHGLDHEGRSAAAPPLVLSGHAASLTPY